MILKKKAEVSILVLMDYSFREKKDGGNIMEKNQGLNPCFNGLLIQRVISPGHIDNTRFLSKSQQAKLGGNQQKAI